MSLQPLQTRSVVARSRPLTTFTMFPRLPAEVQLMIWEKAEVLPNVITITEPCDYTKPGPSSVFRPSYKIPPLLHTCRNSRAVVLKTHQKEYSTHLCSEGIFFNFETDALYFKSFRCMRRFFNFYYTTPSTVRTLLEKKRPGLRPEKKLRYLMYDEDPGYHVCVNCMGSKLERMGTPELVVCVKGSRNWNPFVVRDFSRGGGFVAIPSEVELNDERYFGKSVVKIQRDEVHIAGEDVVVAVMTQKAAEAYLHLLSEKVEVAGTFPEATSTQESEASAP